MSKLQKTIGGLLLTLVLIFSMSADAFAADTIVDWDRTGSVSVTPKDAEDGHTVIKGTSFTLYKVAEAANDGISLRYVLTEEFKGSGADLSELNADGLAKLLTEYAGQNELLGTTERADDNGTVAFKDLSLGLYLLVQTGEVNGAYAVDPFLVSVPMTDADGSAWIYDVEASPKAETYELVDVTVKKVWNDGNDTASRPSSVTVKLYDGSALVDTVALNNGNGWSHTWKDLKKSDGYSVAEVGVSGYVTTYSKSGCTFTITNTGGGKGTSSGGDPGGGEDMPLGGEPGNPTLAQTGQLNWPIPLLAGCGMALFAVGWGLVFLKRKNDA